MGESGLVPSTHDFGVLSQIPILNSDLAEERERWESIKTAQAEMNAIIAERRTLEALTRNISPLRTGSIKWARKFLSTQNQKEINWTNLGNEVDGRMITVKNDNGSLCKTYKAYQFKPFCKEFSQNFHILKSNNDKPTITDPNFINKIVNSFDPSSRLFSDAVKKELRGLF